MPIVKELDIDKTQEKFTILEFHLRPSHCLNSWLHSNKFFVYIKFLYYGQVYVNLRVIAKFVIILCINIYNYIYICNVYRSSHSVVLPYSTLISNVPVVGCRLVGSVLHQKQDILSCLEMAEWLARWPLTARTIYTHVYSRRVGSKVVSSNRSQGRV